jgi:uncharacterized cupin superfamily protein
MEKLEKDWRIPRGYIKTVAKLWGCERWIINCDKYCGKILELDPGYECSLHYHIRKDETFHILDGECILTVNDRESIMVPTNTVRIPPGTRHCFRNESDWKCRILEVSTHHKDEDSVRIRPSRSLARTAGKGGLKDSPNMNPDATD